MSKRENALRTLRFERPERITSGLPMHLITYLGCNHEGYDGVGDDSPLHTKWTDIWGIQWEKKQEGIMGYPIYHPLEEPEALKNYKWPDPNDPRICSQIYEMAKAPHDTDTFLTGSHRNLLMEKAEKLIGMENLLVYFYTEPEFVREVFHRYMDFQLGIARHYLDLGVEAVSFSEDLGTQNSLIVSVDMIKEFMLPEYERLFRLYRERGTIIEFHSCGHIEPVLELLMDLGVNVLNPIQVTANDLDRVRAVTQGRMALHGGVNSDIVVRGPKEKIIAETKQRMRQLGAQGGYFCDVDQHMAYPEGHLEALRETVERYGANFPDFE